MSRSVCTVLALVGSLRRGSFNWRLARAATTLAPEGMTIAIYGALAQLPMFDEDLEADGGHPAVEDLRRAVRQADGLLIATPEYNHGVPALLKNALDWLSRPDPDEVLAGKPVLTMGASTGSWGTRLAQASLRQTLFATQMALAPQPALHVRSAAELFDEEGRLTDEATRSALLQQLDGFAKWLFVARRCASGEST